MTTWHHRLLPYPLLAPWTEDYEGSSFGVDVWEAVLSNSRQVKVGVVFRLSSGTLRSLIENGKATYAVEVSCPRTFVRSTHEAPEQGELILDASDYEGEILLTPYVVSMGALQDFGSAEHAAEWRVHRPGGFTVPAAGILAVGNTTRIILEESAVSSVIDLVANSNVPEGTFHIQLDDERIKIHVPVGEKEKIEAVRIGRGASVEFAALFPGLYLHAVAEGLRYLAEHENTRWAFTMRNALDGSGHGGIDGELLKHDALRYAQELLEQPIGTFLTAAMKAHEEGYTSDD